MTGNLLRATAATRESAQEVNLGEENSPTTPAGVRTHDLLIMTPAL